MIHPSFMLIKTLKTYCLNVDSSINAFLHLRTISSRLTMAGKLFWVLLSVSLAASCDFVEGRKLEEKKSEQEKKPDWFFDGSPGWFGGTGVFGGGNGLHFGHSFSFGKGAGVSYGTGYSNPGTGPQKKNL